MVYLGKGVDDLLWHVSKDTTVWYYKTMNIDLHEIMTKEIRTVAVACHGPVAEHGISQNAEGYTFNTWGSKQNGRHFTGNAFWNAFSWKKNA